mmetsp:Transcript_98045/g.272818  ORF Transcript_98045/g.272818 Transcript_98045/m.272818 type:complete len:307 (+) Transcript_98045:43-963(+)
MAGVNESIRDAMNGSALNTTNGSAINTTNGSVIEAMNASVLHIINGSIRDAMNGSRNGSSGHANVTSGFDDCAPLWSVRGDVCPHGSRFYIPGAPFTLPQSGSLPMLLACCYSALPLLAILVNCTLVLQRRRPREVIWLMCSVSTCVAAKFLRTVLRQPRPQSCLQSCGMPSARAAFAMSLLTFVLMWDSLSRVPAAHSQRSSRRVVLVALLLPIPWSGVALGDHTPQQAFAGAVVGVMGAALWLLCFGPCCEGFLNRLLRRRRREQQGGRAGRGAVGREPVLDRSLLTPGFELSSVKREGGGDAI